jgi:hypothetical protein
VLRLHKSQIEHDPDDPDMMIVRSFYVSKRKTGKDHPTPDILLPLVGSRSPFTQHVLDYIELLGQDDNLLRFSHARGWAIIRHMTGEWPHWFRAQNSATMST